MLKVTGSAMPAALTLLPVTVFAATGDGVKEAAPSSGEKEATPGDEHKEAAAENGHKEAAAPLIRDELSLYTAPPPLKTRYVEHEAGQLEQNVATVRRAIEPYTAWCQGAYGKIKPKVQEVVQFGNDSYAYLKNPPKDFYPRAGVIAFSGVLGLFLARGSRIKKLVYPAGLMTVSTSLYYPEKAAAIAKSTGDSMYDSAVQSFAAVEKMFKGPPNKTDKGTEPQPKP
ncbi:MICOS complex subunit MIC26-like [Thunnus maccoyii]|uniref:MICOS complex subunit MIC26-like n=1 Tax=Thunnus maccoyii TaxID=8240 RepID=UPI001C4AECCF|nr:MICOS complex subunit MIC26-like [Thunnus maccoyii]